MVWNYVQCILSYTLYTLYLIMNWILIVQCSWLCRAVCSSTSAYLGCFTNIQCSAKTWMAAPSFLDATSFCPWIVQDELLVLASAAIIDYNLYPLPCHWTSITIGFISNYCFGKKKNKKKSYITHYEMTWGRYGAECSHKDNPATIYQSAEKISFVSGHVTNVAVKCFKSSYITGI